MDQDDHYNSHLLHWLARQRENINNSNPEQPESFSLPHLKIRQQHRQSMQSSPNQQQFFQQSPYSASSSIPERSSSSNVEKVGSQTQSDSSSQIPPFTARFSELSSPTSPPSSASSSSSGPTESLSRHYPSKRMKNAVGVSQSASTNSDLHLNYRPIVPTYANENELQQQTYRQTPSVNITKAEEAQASLYVPNDPDAISSPWFANKFTQWVPHQKNPNLPANGDFPGRFHSAPCDNGGLLENNNNNPYAPELLQETQETDEEFWQRHPLEAIPGNSIMSNPFASDGRNITQFSSPIPMSFSSEFISPNPSGSRSNERAIQLKQQQEQQLRQQAAAFRVQQQQSEMKSQHITTSDTASSYSYFRNTSPIVSSSVDSGSYLSLADETISSSTAWYTMITQAIQRLKDSVCAFENLIVSSEHQSSNHSSIPSEAEEIALANVLHDSSNLTTAMSSSSTSRISWQPADMHATASPAQDSVSSSSVSSSSNKSMNSNASTSSSNTALPALPSPSVFLPYQIQAPCASVSLTGYIIEGNQAFLTFFELESNVDIASLSLLSLFPTEEVITVSSMIRRVIAIPIQPLLSQQTVLVKTKPISVYVLVSAVTLNFKPVMLNVTFISIASADDLARDIKEREELVREVDNRLATETLAYGLHREAQKLSDSLDEHKNKLLAQQNRYGITTKMIEPYLASTTKDGVPAKKAVSNSPKPWAGMTKQQQMQLAYLQKVTRELARLQFNHVQRLSSFMQALGAHSPFSQWLPSINNSLDDSKNEAEKADNEDRGYQRSESSTSGVQQSRSDNSSSTKDADADEQMRSNE